MLYLLAQETPPEDISILNVLILPISLTLIGFLIFYAGWWVENRLTKAPWKWLGLAPVLYGIYPVGFEYVAKYSDPFYNNLVSGAGAKKMAVAHYGALIIPILGVIAIVLFHFFNHKLNLTPDD